MLKFLYNFLFVDQSVGRLSHTKFWSNLGYGTMIGTFIYAVIYGSGADYMLWLIFGAVVVGNRTLKKAIENSSSITPPK